MEAHGCLSVLRRSADLCRIIAEAVHPVVRDIILGGEKYSAVDAFNGQYALETVSAVDL